MREFDGSADQDADRQKAQQYKMVGVMLWAGLAVTLGVAVWGGMRHDWRFVAIGALGMLHTLWLLWVIERARTKTLPGWLRR